MGEITNGRLARDQFDRQGGAELTMKFTQQTKAGMLCDWQIKERCEAYGLFEPFVDHQVREDYFGLPVAYGRDGELVREKRKIISYGLSSYGYDVRLAPEYKVFNNRKGGLIDPLDFDGERLLITESGPHCDIAPNSYILGRTIERFKLQNNQVTDCVGKSTYARCGILINVTPAEPGWEGYLTLEIANATPCPIRVYANMGIAQIRVYEGAYPEVSYADRNGKYQNQPAEPVVPRL